MWVFLSVIALACLALTAIILQKTYKHVPLKELRRKSRKGDKRASLLYRVAAYGPAVDVFLWSILGISTIGFVILASRILPVWLAFILCLAFLWFGFAWLPRSRPSSLSYKIAEIAAPSLAWILARLQPLLGSITGYLARLHPITIHTGLYEKEDLLDLLREQKVAPANRIEESELDIALHALTFGDKTISDYMTPHNMVRFVLATDPIGPVLLNELHKSGFSRFPVIGNSSNEIVGTLYLRDLVKETNKKKIKDVMGKKVYYVHEQQPLEHALAAFLHTKHHMFLGVNDFEEVVGLITIEDVLEQIIGRRIVDEFDRYEDLREVAAIRANSEHKAHKAKAEPEEVTATSSK